MPNLTGYEILTEDKLVPSPGMSVVGTVSKLGAKLMEDPAGQPMLRFYLTLPGHRKKEGQYSTTWVTVFWRDFTFHPKPYDILMLFGWPDISAGQRQGRWIGYLNIYVYGNEVHLYARKTKTKRVDKLAAKAEPEQEETTHAD